MFHLDAYTCLECKLVFSEKKNFVICMGTKLEFLIALNGFMSPGMRISRTAGKSYQISNVFFQEVRQWHICWPCIPRNYSWINKASILEPVVSLNVFVWQTTSLQHFLHSERTVWLSDTNDDILQYILHYLLQATVLYCSYNLKIHAVNQLILLFFVIPCQIFHWLNIKDVWIFDNLLFTPG